MKKFTLLSFLVIVFTIGCSVLSLAQTVFEWQSSMIDEILPTNFNPDYGNHFGKELAISGNGEWLVVGSPETDLDIFDNDEGTVGVYRLSPDDYYAELVFSLSGPISTTLGDNLELGSSVDISYDGSRIVVGTPGWNGARGHVKVYDNNNGTWEQIGQSIVGGFINEFLGKSTALSADGNTLVIGSPCHCGHLDPPGNVKIYELSGNQWVQKGNTLNGAILDDRFGRGLGISDDGNRLIVGAPGGIGIQFGKGIVRAYQFDGVNWGQIGEDIIGETDSDFFGKEIEVSSSADAIVVAAETYAKTYVLVNGNYEQIGQKIGNGFGGFSDIHSMALSEAFYILTISGAFTDLAGAGVKAFYFFNNQWNIIGNTIQGNSTSTVSDVAFSADEKVLAYGDPRVSTNGRIRLFDLNAFEINDNPCEAPFLPTDGSVEQLYSNRYATALGAENSLVTLEENNCATAWCDSEMTHTTWFKFVAPATGHVAINTCDPTDVDTQIAVFSTPDCSSFNDFGFIAANDDTPLSCSNNPYSSYLEVEGLTPGAEYFIMMDGYEESNGLFDISIEPMGTTSTSNLIENGAIMDVFPNPTNGHFAVSFSDLKMNSQLQIFNTLGAVVYEQQISGISNGHIAVNLQQLPSGIYLAHLGNEQQLSVQKIIIE